MQEIRAKMREIVGEWAKALNSSELRELNESLKNINQVLGSTLQNNHE